MEHSKRKNLKRKTWASTHGLQWAVLRMTIFLRRPPCGTWSDADCVSVTYAFVHVNVFHVVVKVIHIWFQHTLLTVVHNMACKKYSSNRQSVCTKMTGVVQLIWLLVIFFHFFVLRSREIFPLHFCEKNVSPEADTSRRPFVEAF